MIMDDRSERALYYTFLIFYFAGVWSRTFSIIDHFFLRIVMDVAAIAIAIKLAKEIQVFVNLKQGSKNEA